MIFSFFRRRRTPSEAPPAIPVLILEQEGFFEAVAIDMDLWGRGQDVAEAVKDLVGAISAQVEVALEEENPSLLQFPAEKKYRDMYFAAALEQANRRTVGSAMSVPYPTHFGLTGCAATT